MKMQKQNGKWSSSLLGSLLSTAAYIGYHEVNKNNKLKDQGLLKPSQRYQIVKASWPAIVSEEKFNDVQRLLQDAKELERSRLKDAKAHFIFLQVFSIVQSVGFRWLVNAATGVQVANTDITDILPLERRAAVRLNGYQPMRLRGPF